MEVGLIGAMFTGDLFTLFVFMELMVLASVSLTAISDDQYGLEAALKYILISSMGTLFLLLRHRGHVCHLRHTQHGADRADSY